jgi:D-alanine-D-alanine ligase
MKATWTVAVLLGGPSAEREVSLRSGAAVAAALRGVGHRVVEVDPVGNWELPAGVDVVYLALHGTYGEDGQVQEVLEGLGVPYTGTGVEGSRVAFDKGLSKERFVVAGVPTARFTLVSRADEGWPAGWEPPVVLKPVRQGSSVGLQFVDRREDWREALAGSLAHDASVLVEERVVGREVTVAVLEGKALPLVEVRPKTGVFDYRNKYTAGATEFLCPAPMDTELTERVQAAALAAFTAVGGRDYGRVDVMVRGDGRLAVLEVNTLPGMTETSLYPRAARAAGWDFGALCERMTALAWARAGVGVGSGKEAGHVA